MAYQSRSGPPTQPWLEPDILDALRAEKAAGTAAVIGMARQRGLIPSARAVFAQLHASDFRIAVAVIETVLKRCGESDLRQ